MADIADELLARAREIRKAWLDAPDRSDAEFEAAQGMYRAFHDLDRLLSAGGPLPAAWASAVRPQRGDEVEAWLLRKRDEMSRFGDDRATLDWLLDDYRERADTGTPLGEDEVRKRDG